MISSRNGSFGRGTPLKYSVTAAASIFNVSVSTIHAWVKRGEFVAPELGHLNHGSKLAKFWSAADIEKEKLKRGIK